MKKPLAELIGTYLLVFVSTSAVVSGLAADDGRLTTQTIVQIGLTFGFALVAIVYAFGPISGAHVNPAVTLGMLIAKKIEMGDAVKYWVAQFLGGILAAITLRVGYGEMAGRFNYGADAPGDGFGVRGALAFEIVSTMLFFLVIYGAAASKRAAAGFAGIPIGLYLAVSHFAGIRISGSSVNPARDLGPALLAGGEYIDRLWIYFVGPLAGGALGGLLAGLVHEGHDGKE
jgi:aquaporin Z